METTEAYELQIFNIIEEIQDTIEAAEGQIDSNAGGQESMISSQDMRTLKKP